MKRKHYDYDSDESNPGPSALAPRAEELAVVGIDFGTRGTGYAYAFTVTPDVIVPKQPGGANDDVKALTVLLLDEHGGFKSFGHQAREDFLNADNGARGAAARCTAR
jgi:hypothetical protein